MIAGPPPVALVFCMDGIYRTCCGPCLLGLVVSSNISVYLAESGRYVFVDDYSAVLGPFLIMCSPESLRFFIEGGVMMLSSCWNPTPADACPVDMHGGPRGRCIPFFQVFDKERVDVCWGLVLLEGCESFDACHNFFVCIG